MKKIYLTFTLFYFCSSIFAQNLFFKQKPLLFFEQKSNQTIIIEQDSIIYKINSNEKILLKRTDYPETLNQYLPFYINNKTFLVHEGCGVVLEYRNDSIVRVDKSFLHKNQFDAAKFIYNNEIYYFGGYGLFTFKNILINYDFEYEEWEKVDLTFNNEIPPISSFYSYFEDHYLYIMGGIEFVEDKKIINDKYIYRLNLKSKIWNRFKTDFFNDHKSFSPYRIDNNISFINFKNNMILLDHESQANFNFNNNEVFLRRHKFNLNYPISSYILNEDYIYIIVSPENTIKKGFYVFQKLPIKDIFEFTRIRKEPIYYVEQSYNLYGLIILIILSFGFFIYKKRRIISYYLNSSYPFQYREQVQTLYFKGKKVKHLSEYDIKILNKIASLTNQFISLNDFNEIFTIDYESENYLAIVKRREKKLEVFLKLLANVSNYDIKDLLEERKNELDKRIKEVLFLPNKIKFIQK